METRRVLAAAFLTFTIILSANLSLVPPALATSGSYPGTNGKIVFEQEGTGLWIMNADESGLYELIATPTGAHYTQPTWSPDGTRIVFSNIQGPATGLYIISPQPGSIPQLIPNTSGLNNEGDPAWSPDGLKIAYIRNEASGTRNIDVINIDGTGLITLLVSSDAIEPSWSADGTKIAYSTDPGGNVFIIDVATKAITQLVTDAKGDDPVWSPGCPIGHEIAYTSSVGISIVDVNTKQVRIFDTNPADGEPNWSPDGQFIIFQRTNIGIFIKNADGSGTAVRLDQYSGNWSAVEPNYQRLGGRVCAGTTGTTGTACPTYQTNLAVIRVDSTPHEPVNTKIGEVVVTIFHVVYPDGSPVILNPLTVSVIWSGNSSQKEFDNVPVTPVANDPGYYNYTATFTADIAQATGQGLITISIATCSCSDAAGNHGPTGNQNSLNTLDISDDSQVAVNPTTTTTTTTQTGPLITSLDVLFLILALLIIALLLLVARSRRKGK